MSAAFQCLIEINNECLSAELAIIHECMYMLNDSGTVKA